MVRTCCAGVASSHLLRRLLEPPPPAGPGVASQRLPPKPGVAPPSHAGVAPPNPGVASQREPTAGVASTASHSEDFFLRVGKQRKARFVTCELHADGHCRHRVQYSARGPCTSLLPRYVWPAATARPMVYVCDTHSTTGSAVSQRRRFLSGCAGAAATWA